MLKHICHAALLLLLSNHLFAQTGLEQTIKEQTKLSATRPTEKVYLHLDKPYYATGDTLWFKAYLVTGSKHELSAISNALNVELIDSRDSVKKSIKLFVKNGLCQGDLDLPFTLESGTYRIRAYTNWMRNAGEDYFFDKTITIINPGIILKAKTPDKTNTIKAASLKQAAPKLDVQFFPEGGNLGVGIPSKVAFKATNVNGLGTAVNGVIVDDQNNTVASFESGHLGMGVFMLTAEAGKTYSAKIKLGDSSVRVIPLPKAINNGYVFNVSPAGPDHIRVIAQSVSDAQTGTVTLVGQSGGVIYYEGKSKPGSNSFTTTIAKNKFPTGIVQFTLFSSAGEPLNERLIFVQNNDQLKMDVATEKQTYSIRQNVKLNLTAKTNDNQPALGSFSVSVIDETKVPVDDANENTILSNLLLTSDLKGYIEKPGYYFASADQKTADDLDALMLTQGYRSFEWKKAANTAIYEPETGLTVSGYVKTYGGKAIANGKVQLFATGGTFLALDTTADSKGHFVFKDLSFNDSTKMLLQGSTEKDRNNLQISLDKPYRPKAGKDRNMYVPDIIKSNNTTGQLTPFIESSKVKYEAQLKYNITDKSKLLKEVIIKDYINKPVLKHSDNLNGAGNADYVFTAKDIASFKCGFITTCLEGRIPGVGVSNNGANSFLYLTKIAAMNWGRPVPMLVLIDGNPGDINLLSPNSIESIEVLSSLGRSAIYGGRGGVGVVVITTKRGADEVDITIPSPGTITYRTNGFEKVREFYSPQYDNPKTNREIADLRITIYWNPMVQTDKDGNASLEYFNAGSKGNYKVIVEGIDNDGNIGRCVYRYKVE